jgi:hypothetical protein
MFCKFDPKKLLFQQDFEFNLKLLLPPRLSFLNSSFGCKSDQKSFFHIKLLERKVLVGIRINFLKASGSAMLDTPVPIRPLKLSKTGPGYGSGYINVPTFR